jgi:uncharacterized protein involved in exopolysaccharide biosynthesis
LYDSATETRLPAGYGMLPRVGALEAVRRHKVVFALPLILLVGLALAYSLTRSPNYTAESRQSVGRFDLNQPGALTGFETATQALAGSYSRRIEANVVVDRVARRMGMSPALVRKKLSATPIPESPDFKVVGVADTPEQAIRLTKTGSTVLHQYVAASNAEGPEVDRLLRAFKKASFEASHREDDYKQLQKSLGSSPSPKGRRLLSESAARVDAARLAADVARQNYATNSQIQAGASKTQTLTEPQTASSDAWPRMQIALFAAMCLGLLIGVALATLKANRQIRRALTIAP